VLDPKAQICRFVQLDGNGHIDGAQVEHSHFGHYPPGPALSQQSKAVPLFNSQSHQPGCKLVDLFAHLPVGGGPVLPVPLFPHIGASDILVDVFFEKLNQRFHYDNRLIYLQDR